MHALLQAARAESEERERERLAQLLHDDFQPMLVGARCQLACLRRMCDSQIFQSTIDRIDAIMGECLTISRTLTAEFNAPVLLEAGLVSALRWLAQRYQERHGLNIEVKADQEILADGQKIYETIFQATRELLLNIVKHAQAKTVMVQLHRAKKCLVCIVKDNGIGFNPAKLRKRESTIGGYGLPSLRERIESVGGHLIIESAPTKGSRFVMSFPIRAATSKAVKNSATKS